MISWSPANTSSLPAQNPTVLAHFGQEPKPDFCQVFQQFHQEAI